MGKKRKENKGSIEPLVEEEDRKLRRMERFADWKANELPLENPKPIQTLENAKPMEKIKGKSKELEKAYFRLTSAPNPENIRNQKILKKSLKMVQQKWIQTSDYKYVAEQLKSIRQDLTVQGVKNNFALEVYCTHARIALEVADMDEFSQCQAVISELHQQGLKKYFTEFLSYKILYLLYTENHLGMITLLSTLSPESRNETSVLYCLNLWRAFTTSDYCQFFRMYYDAPDMCAFLLDFFVDKIRDKAWQTLSHSYNKIPVLKIQRNLGFESVEECLKFLDSKGAKMNNQKTMVFNELIPLD